MSLGGVIGQASQLAESVSCKVRLLDQAKVSSYGGDVSLWVTSLQLLTAGSSVCMHEESG